jgi:cobalamin biosynthesis Mg chelatase CobN
MKCFGIPVFILLLPLSSTAFAETYKCTDAQGNVSYTNTECQSGSDVKNVKDQTNLVDYSKERQFAERELARAKAKASSFNGLNPMNTSILIVLVLALGAVIWKWWSRRH